MAAICDTRNVTQHENKNDDGRATSFHRRLPARHKLTLPYVFEIIDQNKMLGYCRQDFLLAAAHRLFEPDYAVDSTKDLHAATMEDLQKHFSAIKHPSDCTEEWICRNEEIYVASFAKKCTSKLFVHKDRKLEMALTKEFILKQKRMRKARKVALSQMSTDQREIEKAKHRFLRTAVNFPVSKDCNNQSATARMLLSEFDILMRQFGVQIVSKAELESLFEAVKADKPERNYITLEQFLAWYRRHPRVASCFQAKARKWRSVRSGNFDIATARLSLIRYCNRQARARGRKIFQSRLKDFLRNLTHRDKAAVAASTVKTSQVSTDTSQVSTMASAPLTPRAHDTSDSSCSARGASARQRQQRARGHHPKSKPLSRIAPCAAPSTDYDTATDSSYSDRVKADSGAGDDTHRSSEYSGVEIGGASEDEETYMNTKDMSTDVPSHTRTNSAQHLIDSLLDFSRHRDHHPSESKRVGDVDALSPSEPCAAPSTDYDTAADSSYSDRAKADSGAGDDAHRSSEYSGFEIGGGSEDEETYMDAKGMSTDAPSLAHTKDMSTDVPSHTHANSAQHLIDSLLDFSYDHLTVHAEASSPRHSASPRD